MQSSPRTTLRRQRQAIATRQILTFSLRGEWFAFLLEEVFKVILLDRTYQAPDDRHVHLTLYQGQEITLMDLGFCLFGRDPSPSQDAPFAVVLPPWEDQWLGIPLYAMPAIRRIPQDALKPLPQIYQDHTKLHCISDIMIEAEHQAPAIFLINAHHLRQRHTLMTLQASEPIP